MERRADYVFILYIGILLFFGLMMLTSASSAVGIDRFGDSYYFIKRQLLYGLLPGMLAFFVFAKIPYGIFQKHAWFIFTLTLAGLILVFIPGIGSSFGTGANSWIALGQYSFQPSEFAKLGLIIFMAAYLSKKGSELMDFQKGFLPSLAVGGLPIILVILQPDIGTVAILFSILYGALFVAGAKKTHMGLLASTGVLLFAIMIVAAPYRAARFTTFLHPELDPQGVGYQINQSFIAIGSGGMFGLGLGHSRQKFQYLPEVHADSIFAVVAEEMGFVFATGLIVLLVLIAMRGMRIAKHAPDPFARILVSGIIVWFLSQSFLNIGAMLGLLPVTGVPLPFVSHGGTALMVALAAVGIVANISKHSTKPL
jgi:cell division protein FtsW